MKDAFGGIFNLAIVAVFLVVVMGILGLTVNYIKAFKAKNIIIAAIEEYGGSGPSCFNTGYPCFEKIKRETESIGYHPTSLNCPSETIAGQSYYVSPRDSSSNGLFCFTQIDGSNDDKTHTVYDKYAVITQVDIDLPIINKIMGLYFFQVKGDTRAIRQ